MIKDPKLNKEVNLIFKQAQRAAKRDECLLCGRKCDSFCNSHIIPLFVLKNIAENGYVFVGTHAFDSTDTFDSLTGVKKAWTFQVICHDCDKKYFADYEDEDSLLNGLSIKSLAEIGLKNSMMQIAKRTVEISLHEQHPEMAVNINSILDTKRLDLRDYQYDFYRFKKIIDKDLNWGIITLYCRVLDYVAPIAMQGPIGIDVDMDGDVVNNVHDYNPSVKMQQMHCAVLPLRTKTLVLLFHHGEDRHFAKFDKKFRRLNDADKLQYINYLIIKHCEHYAISPQIKVETRANKLLERLSLEVFDSPNVLLSAEEIFAQPKLVSRREIPNLLAEENKLR